MTRSRLLLIATLLVLSPVFLLSAAAGAQSLDGAGWHLAMDPMRRGESLDWHKPPANWDRAKPAPADGWDAVPAPHCWTTDARFGEYTGIMWYRRSFVPVAPAPGETEWRLTFGAVGERFHLWINGHDLGAHDSVGIPVAIDVTSAIEPGRQNHVAIAVDNSWDTTTIPGARTGKRPGDQLYPWLNYGGLLGPITLESLPAARVDRQKIETILTGPDTARVTITITLAHGVLPQNAAITIDIIDPENPGTPVASQTRDNALADNAPAATFDLHNITRWTLASRKLYESRVTVRTPASTHTGTHTPASTHTPAGTHTHTAAFGIRDIRVAGGQFLLNGDPVRLAGANRTRENKTLDGIVPPEAVAQSLRLMKDAGLLFARLQHYPVSTRALDWADRNGMLIIIEYPFWGAYATDLARPEIQARFQAGMGAFIRETWNHPSVVGWSIGNEYESWLPEGVAWTKQMFAFVKTLDTTRPVTFAALGTPLRILREKQQPAETFSMHHVDFICANIYFKPEDVPAFIDPVHETWPGKPVLITEFGLRADRVKNEQERLAHFDKMFAIVRARPWICGFSFWSFNDYPSRYPGTGLDGYRRWGLVDETHTPRALYHHVARELKTTTWQTPAHD
ncbi:MAG: beta galactosidase jelly roll domain-containing protein [Opitutaceae bacterium]|nr:beta galactosidase jelly roll domain-containing protein [Opitutaceae bacterium]